MSLHDDLPIFERPQAVRLVVYVIGEGQPDRFGHDDAASEMQHRRDPVFREDVVDEMSIACIADHQWHARRYDLRISGRQVVENDHVTRSEEHTSELQSLMSISYAVFCLKQKNNNNK